MFKILLLALILTDPFQGIVGTETELSQVHQESLCILDDADNWTVGAFEPTSAGFTVLQQIIGFQTTYLKLDRNGVPIKTAQFEIHGQIKDLKRVSTEHVAGYSTSFQLIDGQTVRKSWIWGFNLNRARNLREDYLEGVTIHAMATVGDRAYFFAHNGNVYEANVETREVFLFLRVVPPGVVDVSYDSQRLWIVGNGVSFSLLTMEYDSMYDSIDHWHIDNKSELFEPGTGFVACDSYFNRTVLLGHNKILSLLDGNIIAERPIRPVGYGGISLDRLGSVWYHIGNERALHRDSYDLTSRWSIETTHKINFVEMVKF